MLAACFSFALNPSTGRIQECQKHVTYPAVTVFVVQAFLALYDNSCTLCFNIRPEFIVSVKPKNTAIIFVIMTCVNRNTSSIKHKILLTWRQLTLTGRHDVAEWRYTLAHANIVLQMTSCTRKDTIKSVTIATRQIFCLFLIFELIVFSVWSRNIQPPYWWH